MLKKHHLVYLLLILFFACEKDDEVIKEDINLKLSISLPQFGGVVLEANYTGLNQKEISESGFLLSTQQTPGFNNSILVDGKMIDEVHFKQAKALLELVK